MLFLDLFSSQDAIYRYTNMADYGLTCTNRSPKPGNSAKLTLWILLFFAARTKRPLSPFPNFALQTRKTIIYLTSFAQPYQIAPREPIVFIFRYRSERLDCQDFPIESIIETNTRRYRITVDNYVDNYLCELATKRNDP